MKDYYFCTEEVQRKILQLQVVDKLHIIKYANKMQKIS